MKNIKTNLTGLVITAGLSSRMGKFKPLLSYDGNTFLEKILSKLSYISQEIIVVTGFKTTKVEDHISSFKSEMKSDIRMIYNPEYELGMFTSLKKGLEYCKTEWVVYHFADQPIIPQKFYYEFQSQIKNDYNWIQPSYKGIKGHPIIFDREVITKINNSETNANLREISKNNGLNKYFWECNFKEILVDIDTPEDFNKIKKS